MSAIVSITTVVDFGEVRFVRPRNDEDVHILRLVSDTERKV